MNAAQQRAMVIARELSTLNEVRARRAAIIAVYRPKHQRNSAGNLRGGDQGPTMTAAAWAGYLMGTAMVDQRRRALRLLLADQLTASAPS